MAYGLSFFKGSTTGFDNWIATTNAANPTLRAQYVAEQLADNTGIAATRANVVEAFLSSINTPIIPTNTEIRGWMISGLTTFTTYYDSLYNTDSAWRTKIIADRAFESTVISPLTIRQEANQNGSPSQSTQDGSGFNKTAFLLGIDNGTSTEDVVHGVYTQCNNTITRNETFYTQFPKSNYMGTVAYNGSSSYTRLFGGNFIVPQSTNWCAEAWIYPSRFGGGILGSGDYGPGSWQLFHNPSNGVIQLISELIVPVTRTFTTYSWSNYSLSIYGTFPPPGIVVGTQLTPPAAFGAVSPMYVTGIDYENSIINVTPRFAGGDLDEEGTPNGFKRTYVQTTDEEGNVTSTTFPDEFNFTYTTNVVQTSYMDSGARTAPTYTWTHVAASLNGSTLQLFVNGFLSATRTIVPQSFKPNYADQGYYIGVYEFRSAWSSYFQGYIASPRLVNGKAIYTGNFTPSVNPPRASRINVIKAFSNNLSGPVVPPEREIQYWMFRGFDSGTLQFSSTDVTWNQVDNFYKEANTNVGKTYPSCVGKEMLVTQILIGTPDFNKPYYANTITTNSSGAIYLEGANVDTYITVLMR
jgi:hypothetical protein